MVHSLPPFETGSSPRATGSQCDVGDDYVAKSPTDFDSVEPDQFAIDSLEEDAQQGPLNHDDYDDVYETFDPRDCVCGGHRGNSSPEDDLPCAVLLESLNNGGAANVIECGGPRVPSSRREDSVDWPDNLSALLDEIFSEAEESCTTPFPALPPASESVGDTVTAPSQQQDERGDAEIYVNVPPQGCPTSRRPRRGGRRRVEVARASRSGGAHRAR
ncbi:hypothetical protein MTO96_047647 [Rhipicephalus appendiculatus]